MLQQGLCELLIRVLKRKEQSLVWEVWFKAYSLKLC